MKTSAKNRHDTPPRRASPIWASPTLATSKIAPSPSPPIHTRHVIKAGLALLGAALCFASACSNPVLDARRDQANGPRPAPLSRIPTDLDLDPNAQSCQDDASCTIVYGVPGQRIEALCCATCDPRPRVLNLDNALSVARWKERLECGQVACPSLGGCGQQVGVPTEARCIAGLCALP